jgi:hypothetical protein
LSGDVEKSKKGKIRRKIMKKILFILSTLLISHLAWGGQLSPYEEELIQKVKSVFTLEEKEAAPYPETIAHPLCATPIFVEVNAVKKNLSLEAQKILNSYTSRPQLDSAKACYTPSGHFKIHYTTVGVDSVYEAHVDNDHNGVPDYVDNCAQILDYVWAKEVDSLGYDSPPSDGFYPTGADNGGDGKYDVYLMSMDLAFFGYTQSDSPLVGSTYKYTSYIVLRNDYSMYKNWYQELYDPLKVTCAHEFFHSIHFGYDATEYESSGSQQKPYWMEITAVWMEDQVYDQINDYLHYIPYFYNAPWVSLKSFKNEYDRHPYGSCVWAFFLQERFKDTGLVKKIWERCAQVPGDNVIEATDEVLMDTAYKSSLEDAFREFTVWNWFIGDRAMPDKFYSEGNSFKDTSGLPMQVKVSATFSSYPIDSSSVFYPPEVLGSNYVRFIPYDSSGGLKVLFDGNKYTNWKAFLLGYRNDLRPTEVEFQLDSLQDGQAQIDNWNNYSDIILIPAVASREKGTNTYPYDYFASYDSSLYGTISYPPWVRVFGNPPFIAYVGNTLTFSVKAIDQNLEDTLTLTKYGEGDFLTIQGVSPLTGSFSWTPGIDDIPNSPYEDTFIVVDKSGLADTTLVQIYVKIIPKKDVAEQNVPNPFVVGQDEYTYFPFNLASESRVEISIFTLNGELVKRLEKTELLKSGYYGYDNIRDLPFWDGKNEKGEFVSSGIYLYYFKTYTTTQLKKMVVIR